MSFLQKLICTQSRESREKLAKSRHPERKPTCAHAPMRADTGWERFAE